MPIAHSVRLLVCPILTLGCVPRASPDPVDDFDEVLGATSAALTSSEEVGILRLANDVSEGELTAASGLHLSIRVTMSLLAHRRGPDGREATLDDDPFNRIEELDDVPGVGPRVLERMRTYVAVHPVNDDACEATTPRPFPMALVVAPDDGSVALGELIDGAERQVDVTIYQLSRGDVTDALTRAQSRGVAIRVILDRQQPANVPMMSWLQARGIEARLSTAGFVYTHQKSVIVDGEAAFIFSGNFDRYGFESGRNYGAIDRDFEDVRDMEAIFEADWRGERAELPCTRLLVAPLNTRSRLLALIARARRSIDVEAMYLSDSAVLTELLQAARRGVVVRALFNDPDRTSLDAGTAARAILRAGGQVRRSPAFIHAKVLLVDGQWAFFGSTNFSANSLDRNREVSVIVEAASFDYGRMARTFGRDWQAADSYF